MPNSIPESHKGIHYYEFMSKLSNKRAVSRYLEIGVNEGQLLSLIHATHAVGVDPKFVLRFNISAHKKYCDLVQVGSDEFFRDYGHNNRLSAPPDLIFLDGMHTFEFLLRDFYNSEQISDRCTLIGMHDCLPLNAEMMMRNQSAAVDASSEPFKNWWTGDVWKIIPILRKYRPDLRMVFVDCPPTGLVFITNLDPFSTVLRDRYHEIINEYHAIANDLKSLMQLYDEIKIVRSSEILNDFDHSLFFST